MKKKIFYLFGKEGYFVKIFWIIRILDTWSQVLVLRGEDYKMLDITINRFMGHPAPDINWDILGNLFMKNSLS